MPYIPKDLVNIIQGYVDDLEALDKHKKWFPKFKRELDAKYWDKNDRQDKDEKLISCKDCGVWTSVPICYCDVVDKCVDDCDEISMIEWTRKQILGKQQIVDDVAES